MRKLRVAADRARPPELRDVAGHGRILPGGALSRALAAETLTLERKLKAEGSRLNAESLLSLDPGGDWPDVANRPAPRLHPPARLIFYKSNDIHKQAHRTRAMGFSP